MGQNEGYESIRLNAFVETGWAVIRRPSGAIVVGDDGRLMMRLTREDARAKAAALSREMDRTDDLEAEAG